MAEITDQSDATAIINIAFTKLEVCEVTLNFLSKYLKFNTVYILKGRQDSYAFFNI